MKDQVPTVCARELAAAVTRVRVRAGFTESELAEVVRWSRGRMSRLESGRRVSRSDHPSSWSEAQVAVLLGICGVVGGDAVDVLRLWRDSHLRTWLRAHGGSPDIVDILIRQESIAATITEYEPLAVPSLLQTADYACAVLRRVGWIPDEAVDLWVRTNQARRAIFSQQHPQQPFFRFFVSEQVLRRPIADLRVMNDQFQQMVVMSTLPQCVIRVIPDEAVDPVVGPFRLMEYADYNPVVSVRNFTTSLFLEEPDDVHAYRAVLAGLDTVALNAHQSQQLLQQIADRFDQKPAPQDRH